MESTRLRKEFMNFFESKGHHIVPSAPIVVKNDPTLMFTNAGMNQFKDIFLGNAPVKYPRVANSQKCLRVSGKHNDLEEVGHDTFHHTMFEMLGNWSFGDYFKKEAIAFAYEFLTVNLSIPPGRLYATVFEGSPADSVDFDHESWDCWKEHLPAGQILKGTKEDNFWEMGDTGPCGPCSEIHLDMRSEKERKETEGAGLVNTDHPLVIEIWNLVFIQFNRSTDGSLSPLPDKHVDTGMGFERLCMVMQNKMSTYDTDLFQPIINEIGRITNISPKKDNNTETAVRVISDHLRAVSFSIADGQIPSNNKAGYVIRRILRRAIRYGFTFLDRKEPFICKLVRTLVNTMGEAYPEIVSQQQLIERVIEEEEKTFLKTLDTGIRMLERIISQDDKKKEISGKDAFELYDTYGFPLDLTQLIARENGFVVNTEEFNSEMEAQKSRSRKAAKVEAGDWVVVREKGESKFVGYDRLSAPAYITRYRKVRLKGKEYFQIILDQTPFYGESGGQIGDCGCLENERERIGIFNTVIENDINVHLAEKLPEDPGAEFNAIVDREKRMRTANNHTATHLLHECLREVLGGHVEQKGSLVHYDYLRFDFSHFQKTGEKELQLIESCVNRKIRENIPRNEEREISLSMAKKKGAISLFGEKYGETVRTVSFGKSTELCGGTHAEATGQIGFFKIVSETAIAAGIRRIEALTGEKAEKHVRSQSEKIEQINQLLKSKGEPVKAIRELQKEKNQLEKKAQELEKEKIKQIKQDLKNKIQNTDEINIIAEKIEAGHDGILKDTAFQLKGEVENLFLALGAEIKGKAILTIIISDNLVREKELNAARIIREISPHIKGGGGGQEFFATAGGKNPAGISEALNKAVEIIKTK